MFIIVDGIDGSGKSTVTRSWRDMLEARGHKLFDTAAFEKAHGLIATIDDINGASVIVSAEPGHAGVSKKIREEMLRPNSTYTAREITEAFADQRLERYEALIIPAIERGLLIVQDRGITTSLAYQPTMSSDISEDFVAGLPGNQLAIQYRPDYVIICEVPADVAIKRLSGRLDKNDDAIFEQRDYTERLTARFRTESWKSYLTKNGTKFITFNADQPLALAIKAAQHVLVDLL